jgi:hypothetical protein
MGTPTATATPTPSMVYADLDGDGESDVAVFRGNAFIVSLSADQAGNGGTYTGAAAGAIAWGTGRLDGDLSSTLVYVKRAGSQLSWHALAYRGGRDRTIATFGGRGDTPVIGCHIGGAFVAATFSTVGARPVLKYLLNGTVHVIRLDARAVSAFCSADIADPLTVYTTVQRGKRQAMVETAADGTKLLETAPFPATWKMLQEFTIPETPGQPETPARHDSLARPETISAAYRDHGLIKFATYNTNLHGWIQIPISSSIATAGVSDVTTGVLEDSSRWIAVLTPDNNVVISPTR